MENSSRTYSPFWALQFLVLCLGVWGGNSLLEVHQERIRDQEAFGQLVSQGKAALVADKKLSNLIQDLKNTEETDGGAAQVLQEFKLSP